MIDETSRIRFIVTEKIIVQSGLFIKVLVLLVEGSVCAIRNLGFLFQTAPAGVVAEPQQITVFVCHLERDAVLVAVEVVGLLAAFSVFVDVVLTGETAYVPHVPYVKNEGFLRATIC